MLYYFMTTPLDFWMVQIKSDTFNFLRTFAFLFLLLGLLLWVYKRLTRPEVLTAIQETQDAAKSISRNPKIGFIYGGILSAVLGIGLFIYSNGHIQDEAIKRAKEQVGRNYKFHITSFNMHSSRGKSHYKVEVAGYNANEIKRVPLEWDE